MTSSTSTNVTANENHEWLLPMPSGISLSPHNSFTIDLLSQFDKRRSQLHFDFYKKEQEEQQQPPSNSVHHVQSDIPSSIINSPSSSSSSISITKESTNNQDRQDQKDLQQHQDQQVNRLRSTAGNLLRKSSVYLRNKFNEGFQHTNTTTIREITFPDQTTTWTLKRKKKFHQNNYNRPFIQDIIFNSSNNNNDSSLVVEEPTTTTTTTRNLSKIAINTTINISANNPSTTTTTNNNNNAILQPPIITQYPPKPLRYSPVEPLPDEHYAGIGTIISYPLQQEIEINLNENSHGQRKLLHRLSLPLLRLTAASQQQQAEPEEKTLSRRRSDSDLLNQVSNSNSGGGGVLNSISRKWNKLLFTCKKVNLNNNNKKKKVTL